MKIISITPKTLYTFVQNPLEKLHFQMIHPVVPASDNSSKNGTSADKSSENGPPESIQTKFRKRKGKNIETYICPIIEEVQSEKETNKNFNLETPGDDFNAKSSGSSNSGKSKRPRTTKLDKNTKNLNLGQENVEKNFDSGIFF